MTNLDLTNKLSNNHLSKNTNSVNKCYKDDILPDIQNNNTEIELAIDKVGITNIIMPVKISTKCLHAVTSTANFSIYVNLSKNQKGTHMSRFITKLQEYINSPISSISLKKVANEICNESNSENSFIECSFKYFINKIAPMSKLTGLMDYDVCFKIECQKNKVTNKYSHSFNMIVKIPITAVCPCSKEISKYGAHNQRGIITIDICMNQKYDGIIWIEDIIDIAEKSASCELYPILKRVDEKYVTEKGYECPQFVEDTVRRVANKISNYKKNNKISNYIIKCKNYESIHNHNAYAIIKG